MPIQFNVKMSVVIEELSLKDFRKPKSTPPSGPQVNFEFIPTGSQSGGQIQWRGVGVGNDGRIYHIPYYKDHFLITDPETDTTSIGWSTTDWPASNSQRKWVDCAQLADGRLIANPHLVHGHAIIDPANTADPLRAVNTVRGPITYGMQVRAGAQVGNTYFSPSYDTSPGPTSVVRVLDTDTEIYGQFLSFTIRRDGPFYQQNPASANGRIWGALCTDTYWGAAAADNGKIYAPPFGQERWLVIDGVNKTAVQGEDTMTGGAPLVSGDVYPGDHYMAKYTGATRSSINGCIYSMPRGAHAIGKMDPATDQAIEIPLPEDYEFEIGDTKSLGSVEGPDGRIYGTLWQVPKILWIDPRTDEIGWIDMTPYLEQTGSTRNFYAYAARVGDSIYFSPGSATRVMKMTIVG